MRILKIDGNTIDIDNETVLAFTFQTYDIKNPSLNKVTISNSFTLPCTSKNIEIFGFANNIQSENKTVYGFMLCDYWIDNDQYVEGGKIRVEAITDRIQCVIYDKKTVWSDLKFYKWIDFIKDFRDWERLSGEWPPAVFGTFTDFITPLISSTEGVTFKAYLSNLALYDPSGLGIFVETKESLQIKTASTDSLIGENEGGHLSIYIKTIFKFLEYKFAVNFGVDEIINGNIWNDAVATKIFIPVRNLVIKHFTEGTEPELSHFWYLDIIENASFAPNRNLIDKGDKTVFDMVDGFLKHFNCCIDNVTIDNVDIILMRRFDDIQTLAPIVNFSGKISGKPIFKPLIENIYQSNQIKFKSIFINGDDLLNSRTLTCLNKNIDAKGDLFEIDAHVPDFVQYINGEVIPDLSDAESFKTFEFLISDGIMSNSINIGYQSLEGGNVYNDMIYGAYLEKAALYDLQSEYLFYDSIIKYPKVYEIKKWMSLNDIRKLEFFKQYYIQELNGCFFINKISGFNPEKSLEPTTLELIKISDKTPIIPNTLQNFWTDGLLNIFTDGNGNYYF